MTSLALVPARAGSKRIPHKNTKVLGGYPLIVWTLRAAHDSDCYTKIAVCTDDPEVRDICRAYPHLWDYLIDREPVDDLQPDSVWVSEAVEKLGGCETFSILRPTSPFRGADTVRRAWYCFKECSADSLRAMRRVREHPLKMWEGDGDSFYWSTNDWVGAEYEQPWNQPTQSLRSLYIQTAGLEISHSYVLPESISGDRVAPFIVEGPPALDLNTIEDWWVAERYIAEGLV